MESLSMTFFAQIGPRRLLAKMTDQGMHLKLT
jgi:hypothetical protein